MLTDWRQLDKSTVFDGKDEDGRRYLNIFLKQYKDTFNVIEINAGCERCLNEYYTNFIKYLNTMQNKKQVNSKYVLKLKYNGIQKEFGSQEIVTRKNMTDELGDFLFNNHPRGAMLFEELPKNAGSVTAKKVKEDKDHTLKELLKMYPDVEPHSKKKNFLENLKAWKADKEKNK